MRWNPADFVLKSNFAARDGQYINSWKVCMNPLFHNHWLYTMVEMARAQMMPARSFAKVNQEFFGNAWNPLSYTHLGRSIGAGYELFERVTRHYNKPEFGITHTFVNGKEVEVFQKTVVRRTFCRLLHFKKDGDYKQPKMLVVAPMSGHYATLLRGTVEGLLPFYDVYITDWENVRDIPQDRGEFTLGTFIDYVTDFMERLAPELNVMAVCQPSVPVLAAVSLMEAHKNAKTPSSMILIGGPIDTRKSPTEVNNFAADRDIKWFERSMITRVPLNYDGAMREVYPGFMQLSGFMAMNMQRHVGEHVKLFYHLVEGDGESAEEHRKFYNEYLAVMDLPADFYLETVNAVFKDYLLPRGKLTHKGEEVKPEAVEKTGLLAIEGERDDISGIGQTKAALTICKNLPENRKSYYMQKGVGHYGAFNGRKFREGIVPAIMKFTQHMLELNQSKPNAQAKPKAKAGVKAKASAPKRKGK